MTSNGLYLFSLLLTLQLLSTLCYQQNEWEILIFTQRWPLTACSQWEEKNKNNTCAFPDPQDLWTIHGVWPTKPGTIGPENCNKTWHFNEKLIDPIKPQLEEYWTNVEKNTELTSLWKHEWVKHGTCAAILPQLDNEFKYFNQGLEWIKKYNMKSILGAQKIIPSQTGYPIQTICDGVKTVLGKSAIIQCVVDRHTKLSLISEIRICFDKSFNLVGCESIKGDDYARFGDVLTNCNVNKLVVYPNTITPFPNRKTSRTTNLPKWKGPTKMVVDLNMMEAEPTTTMSTLELLYNARIDLITMYRAVKLLIWATI